MSAGLIPIAMSLHDVAVTVGDCIPRMDGDASMHPGRLARQIAYAAYDLRSLGQSVA